jgi:HPt (histidine-containing phosphotransfer) domain-containing protein
VADDQEIDTTKLDEDVIASLRHAVGDAAFADLVQTFVANAAELSTKLAEALRAPDADRATTCAHDLKSTSATFGAMGLSDVYAELERRAGAGDLASLEDDARAAERALARVSATLRRYASQ